MRTYLFQEMVLQRLDRLDRQLRRLGLFSTLSTEKIMSELDDLEAKVAAEESVEQSAITLLGTLKQELDAALADGDMGRIQALSDKIGADTDALSAAITANTPAAPSGS